MIRSELVKRIAAQNPQLHERKVGAAVHSILERLSNALADGDRVELRGIGTFSTRSRNTRRGRNPRTGEHVVVVEKKAVAFKPSKVMQTRLNPGRTMNIRRQSVASNK